jgi:hypothetical protein
MIWFSPTEVRINEKTLSCFRLNQSSQASASILIVTQRFALTLLMAFSLTKTLWALKRPYSVVTSSSWSLTLLSLTFSLMCVPQTAGRGVYHQEHNLHQTLPLRFIQIWMTPRSRGLTPNYGSGQGSYEKRLNQWSSSSLSALLSDPPQVPYGVRCHERLRHPGQDQPRCQHLCLRSLSRRLFLFGHRCWEVGLTLCLRILTLLRQAYFLLIEGDGHISLTNEDRQEESELNQHDGAEIFGPCTVTLTPSSCASSSATSVHALLIEMAETGPGRRDL